MSHPDAAVAVGLPGAPVYRDGRIPFRVRIGVTGHRVLDLGDGLQEAVLEEIAHVQRLLTAESTPLRLAVVSQLAEGADRLVVDQVFTQDEDARLEVVLPVDPEEYVGLQEFSAASREEFERLLHRATYRSEPASVELWTADDRDAAYESAGRQLIARCDVLLALWDGGTTGGRGGTAETLLLAAAARKPCVWISTDGEPTVLHNLDPGTSHEFYRQVKERATAETASRHDPLEGSDDVLHPLREALGNLDEFNHERIRDPKRAMIENELGAGTAESDWVALPFARASVLSERWHNRFRWLSWLISVLAVLAAAVLAIGLSYGAEEKAWHWAEFASLTLALLALVVLRGRGFHRRWLSYRVLAERLRSAYYLAPTGADFRRQAQIEAVYIGDHSETWVMRAFEEIWDRRPPLPTQPRSESEVDELKQWLAEDWLGGQITYHEKAVRRHGRADRILTIIVTGLFVATVPFPFLHALGYVEHAAAFFSITLPAAGASLGALLTINQHRALQERSARMRSDLKVARRTLLDASDQGLAQASKEAAHVIAQETGAWFGAMWFLDLEHP